MLWNTQKTGEEIGKVRGTRFEMVETEREILREKNEEAKFGERKPFESERQATYEDSFAPENDWELEDSQ